jgi:3-hydroxyisobutyrate dehydrogenase-like beta-hydroxyacid dehydrogenase
MGSEPKPQAAPGMPIGIVGLGNMGRRIARRLKSNGYHVLGFDISEAQRAASEIQTSESLAEIIKSCQTVLLSLPDSHVVEAVIYGADGVIAHGFAGQVIVDLSTASPESTRTIHHDLGERGVTFVDAGVSGGPSAAEQGTLTLMVGGTTRAVERLEPLLRTIGTHVFHMGGPSSGHVTKLLNNFLNGMSLAATAEVMVAAAKADLDLKQFLGAVNESTGVNWATLRRFPTIIEGDYAEGGLTSDLMAKDIRLYLDLLRQLGVTSFSGPACLGVFDLASASGYGGQTSNRVVDVLGDLSGGIRVADRTRPETEDHERSSG